jgi:cytochrome c
MDRLLKVAASLVFLTAFTATSAYAAGNATSGQASFVRCAVCHTAQSGGPNRIGPNLFGVVGRKAGTLSSYSYSRAMTKSGITWSEATLTPYLMSPSTVVPGTKMTFAGFSNPQQAADVAAYLATLK